MPTDFRPIDHPCAWNGDRLGTETSWIHQLTASQLREIEAGGEMPETKALLATIREALENGPGVALVRGLATSNIDLAAARKTFLNLSTEIGTPVSQSAEGELVFSVRDAGHAEGDPRARGPNTRKKLSFHSDRCDIIGFLCLQQAKAGGENDLVSSAAIHNALLESDPELLERLYQPFYYMRHTVDAANPIPHCRQPVFSVTDGHFACNLLRVLIDRAYASPALPDMTDLERRALDAIEATAALPGMSLRIRQQPGDILFLNNWVTLHRRSAFEDHEEQERKRHILRVWLSPPNNRPIAAEFADNYGATAANTVRGGMRAL